MREVVIMVSCDACQQQFAETDEGSNLVSLTVYGTAREMDLCDECINGSFIQEARVAKKAKPHVCHCGKAFSTPRGLTGHQKRQGHD